MAFARFVGIGSGWVDLLQTNTPFFLDVAALIWTENVPYLWPTPVIPGLGRLSQEDCHEFKINLGYVGSSRSSRTTQRSYLKKQDSRQNVTKFSDYFG